MSLQATSLGEDPLSLDGILDDDCIFNMEMKTVSDKWFIMLKNKIIDTK